MHAKTLHFQGTHPQLQPQVHCSSSSDEDEGMAAALASVAVSFDFLAAQQQKVAAQGQQNLGRAAAKTDESGPKKQGDQDSDDDGKDDSRGQDNQALDPLQLKIAASLNQHLDKATQAWWVDVDEKPSSSSKKKRKKHKNDAEPLEEASQTAGPLEQQASSCILDLGPGVRLFRKVPPGTHALVLPGDQDQPWVPADRQLRCVEVRDHMQAARAMQELVLLEQALSKADGADNRDDERVAALRKAMKRLRKSLDMEASDEGKAKAVKKALKRCGVAGEEIVAGAAGFKSRAQLDDAMTALKLAILGTKGKRGKHTKHEGEVVEARTWVSFDDRTDTLLGKPRASSG